MISINEALKTILSQKFSRRILETTIEDAVGYCLAQQIKSPLDLPPFNNSAMDGYAVRGYKETYNLKGEIAAGKSEETTLNEGEAVRIFTGGKVPNDSTAVIMQEKTSVIGKLLNISDEVVTGKNIRIKGEEIKKGKIVFESGQKNNPATVGILSSLGLTQVEVFDKPIVNIITTGNELIQPGKDLEEGQIYESNGPTLSAALKQSSFECTNKIQVKDDFDAIKWSIGEELERSDVLLVSGGISVGDYDFVKQALLENGVEEIFHKVDQKPGKPLFFGRKKDTFIFGLPGNPASALISFYIYVLPLLQKLAGANYYGLKKVSIPIAHEYTMKSDRPFFLKASFNDGKVSLLEGQSSSMIHSLAQGNAIAFINKKGIIEEGQFIDCYLLP